MRPSGETLQDFASAGAGRSSRSMPMSGRNIIETTRSSSSSVIVVGSSVAGSLVRCREREAGGAAVGSRRAQETTASAVKPRARRLRERRFIGGERQNSIPRVATVVLDIETAGQSWDSLDDAQRTYLAKNARSDEEREKLPDMLSLWPLTGKIIVVAMLNPESGRGRIWYEKTDGRSEETSADRLFTFVGDEERVFLGEFWKAMRRFQRFVTFNGRGFDGPFLMLRSAALGIPVTRNLVGYRYALKPHTDLLEAISFFGASRKWNLDFACKAFGVESPKEQGMDGFSVGPVLPGGEAARNRQLLPARRGSDGRPLPQARKNAAAGIRKPLGPVCYDPRQNGMTPREGLQ